MEMINVDGNVFHSSHYTADNSTCNYSDTCANTAGAKFVAGCAQRDLSSVCNGTHTHWISVRNPNSTVLAPHAILSRTRPSTLLKFIHRHPGALAGAPAPETVFPA